jgi:SOS-response transcriptional repressor LexA
MLNNTTQGARIKLARTESNLTLMDLAKRCGVKTYQVIQNYESDKREHSKLDLFIRIAETCNVSIEWLLTGKGQAYETIQYYAPIIGWDEIHTWNKVGNTMDTTRYESVPLTQGNKPSCIGLRIKDDSMVSQRSNEDSFKEGDIIIIDLEAKAALDDYVLASINNAEQPILRQFVLTGDGVELKALNKVYPNLKVNETMLIYGVVVGLHRKFTRN